MYLLKCGFYIVYWFLRKRGFFFHGGLLLRRLLFARWTDGIGRLHLNFCESFSDLVSLLMQFIKVVLDLPAEFYLLFFLVLDFFLLLDDDVAFFLNYLGLLVYFPDTFVLLAYKFHLVESPWYLGYLSILREANSIVNPIETIFIFYEIFHFWMLRLELQFGPNFFHLRFLVHREWILDYRSQRGGQWLVGLLQLE